MALALNRPGGIAGWLLSGFRNRQARPRPSLTLVERISIAPRQSLALIEAEGRRFLIATSSEGAPVFYALDERENRRGRVSSRTRVSW